MNQEQIVKDIQQPLVQRSYHYDVPEEICCIDHV